MKNNQLPKLKKHNEDNHIYKYSKYTGKHIVPCCFRCFLFSTKYCYEMDEINFGNSTLCIPVHLIGCSFALGTSITLRNCGICFFYVYIAI